VTPDNHIAINLIRHFLRLIATGNSKLWIGTDLGLGS